MEINIFNILNQGIVEMDNKLCKIKIEFIFSQ